MSIKTFLHFYLFCGILREITTHHSLLEKYHPVILSAEPSLKILKFNIFEKFCEIIKFTDSRLFILQKSLYTEQHSTNLKLQHSRHFQFISSFHNHTDDEYDSDYFRHHTHNLYYSHHNLYCSHRILY